MPGSEASRRGEARNASQDRGDVRRGTWPRSPKDRPRATADPASNTRGRSSRGTVGNFDHRGPDRDLVQANGRDQDQGHENPKPHDDLLHVATLYYRVHSLQWPFKKTSVMFPTAGVLVPLAWAIFTST